VAKVLAEADSLRVLRIIGTASAAVSSGWVPLVRLVRLYRPLCVPLTSSFRLRIIARIEVSRRH